MAMTLVETVTVGSGGAASIEFTNIPQDGKDLLLLLSARRTDSGTSNLTVKYNATTSGYSRRYLTGDGSSASSSNFSSESRSTYTNMAIGSSYAANTFISLSDYIANYTSSSNKTSSIDGVSEDNGSFAIQLLSANLVPVTAAITDISIESNGTFAQYTTASLYIIS